MLAMLDTPAAEMPVDELEHTIDLVMRRASFDADFRALAVSDPSAALRRFASSELPGPAIRFEEAPGERVMRDPDQLVFLLPPLIPSSNEDYLARMENVAGAFSANANSSCGDTCAIASCIWTCGLQSSCGSCQSSAN